MVTFFKLLDVRLIAQHNFAQLARQLQVDCSSGELGIIAALGINLDAHAGHLVLQVPEAFESFIQSF
jgi:hypothetical protein